MKIKTVVTTFVTTLAVVVLLSVVYVSYTTNTRNNAPIINILTRSGKREVCFKKLKQSLNEQTYSKIHHIISSDSPNTDAFLANEGNVIRVPYKPKENEKHCPYNHYLNNLVDNALPGWCMIMDDDAKFINKYFIKELSSECAKSSPRDILVYDIYIGKHKKILPTDKNNIIRYGQIDMAGFAFHSTCNVKFRTKCNGDYFFLTDAKKQGYNIKYVKLSIGVWANYKGWNYGKFVSCDVE